MRATKLLLAVLLIAAGQEGDKRPAAPAVRLRLSCERRLDPGSAMSVRFTIENATDREAEIDEPADYLDGLEVLDSEGKVLRPFGSSKEKKRTVKVEPGGFFGRIVDLGPAVAAAKVSEGIIKVTWKWAGAVSNTLEPFLVREWVATIDTNYGEIRMEFYPDAAPRHVLNFTDLARRGFYEGLTFHRVIPGFMAQGGRAKERPGFRVKAEFNDIRHDLGTVSMARLPGDPDSATSEFFICFDRLPSLDGKYTVFGQVVAGESVLKEIGKVKTDHESPCQKCGKALEAKAGPCCGGHHEDKPKVDVTIKKITLAAKTAK
jgi:cyclophilin family peptidyl-prolyl cis-trans isomerase